jgi:hypothetical protein
MVSASHTVTYGDIACCIPASSACVLPGCVACLCCARWSNSAAAAFASAALPLLEALSSSSSRKRWSVCADRQSTVRPNQLHALKYGRRIVSARSLIFRPANGEPEATAFANSLLGRICSHISRNHAGGIRPDSLQQDQCAAANRGAGSSEVFICVRQHFRNNRRTIIVC